MSGRFSQNDDEIVNLVNSEGEERYMPCPLVLKNIVRAILVVQINDCYTLTGERNSFKLFTSTFVCVRVMYSIKRLLHQV